MSDLTKSLVGLWAVDHDAFDRILAQAESIDATHLAARSTDDDAESFEYDVKNGVATIPIHGLMLQRPGFFMRWLFGAISTTEIGRAVRRAANDPDVREIRLDINSPGGEVAGTDELAAIVRDAAGKKRVTAFASGQMASAAYWVGAQAAEVLASPTTTIGSIGVFRVVADSSEMAKAAGITVHVIRSHELKGVGVSGAPVSKKQLGDGQRLVDDAFAMFKAAVAKGRSMSADDVGKLATGQSWFAEQALRHHLIDAVSMDGTTAPPPGGPEEKKKMSSTSTGGAAETPPIAGQDNETARLRAELAAAKAEAAEANARAAAQAAAIAEQRKTACAGILDESMARVTPGMRPKFDEIAAALGHDPEKLRAIVAELPVQTRPTPLSVAPAATTGPATNALTDEERAMAKAFGITEDEMLAAKSYEGISVDGSKTVSTDGGKLFRRLPRELVPIRNGEVN